MQLDKQPAVTFETKVYERDWRYLLKGGLVQEMISRCDYPFAERVLRINNVEDPIAVSRHADRLVASGVIDSYDIVADHAQDALQFFGLSREDLGKGYYYSIAELVGIHRCQTEYLLHFSSDAILEKSGRSWIPEALRLLQTMPDLAVANPAWNHRYDQVKEESEGVIEDFFLGYGFSDQCYLVATNRFKASIYLETHPDSQRYPSYGGELFEKRVDSYMRNNSQKRITSAHTSYLHRNFPRTKLGHRLFRVAQSVLPTDIALATLGRWPVV